jgi:hypothetical protein
MMIYEKLQKKWSFWFKIGINYEISYLEPTLLLPPIAQLVEHQEVMSSSLTWGSFLFYARLYTVIFHCAMHWSLLELNYIIISGKVVATLLECCLCPFIQISSQLILILSKVSETTLFVDKELSKCVSKLIFTLYFSLFALKPPNFINMPPLMYLISNTNW